MNLSQRVKQLATRSKVGEAARLRKHWERYAEKRAVVFKQFVDAVPEGSYKAVELALTPWVSELHNPQWWGPPEAPALARWIRGLEVGAFPVPLPVSLIDLLLTNPTAEVGLHDCEDCGLHIPNAPSRTFFDPEKNRDTWVQSQPFVLSCPHCSGAISFNGYYRKNRCRVGKN